MIMMFTFQYPSIFQYLRSQNEMVGQTQQYFPPTSEEPQLPLLSCSLEVLRMAGSPTDFKTARPFVSLQWHVEHRIHGTSKLGMVVVFFMRIRVAPAPDLRFFPAPVRTNTFACKLDQAGMNFRVGARKITGGLQHLSIHASTCGPFQTTSAPALVRCVSVQLTTAGSAEMVPATDYIQWICIPWKSKTKHSRIHFWVIHAKNSYYHGAKYRLWTSWV